LPGRTDVRTRDRRSDNGRFAPPRKSQTKSQRRPTSNRCPIVQCAQPSLSLCNPRVRCRAARRTLGTTLGPHAMHLTAQPARGRTQHWTITPPLTSQNGQIPLPGGQGVAGHIRPSRLALGNTSQGPRRDLKAVSCSCLACGAGRCVPLPGRAQSGSVRDGRPLRQAIPGAPSAQ
jgi:hypothetical protein